MVARNINLSELNGLEEAPKCDVVRIQVSRLKKMENNESKHDRDAICMGNIQLGQRMRYSYKYKADSV